MSFALASPFYCLPIFGDRLLYQTSGKFQSRLLEASFLQTTVLEPKKVPNMGQNRAQRQIFQKTKVKFRLKNGPRFGVLEPKIGQK